ncbi:digestive organ expansion factor [Amylostereum chailletii]|nr:digestive organ expansion factor [Amylostereum chailletii]
MLDDPNSPTTRLLTLLNVSAARSTKRKRIFEDEPSPSRKLNQRRQKKGISFAEDEESRVAQLSLEDGQLSQNDVSQPIENAAIDEAEESPDEDTPEVADVQDPYEQYFGVKPAPLVDTAREAVEKGTWSSSTASRGKLGMVVESSPSGFSTKGLKTSSSPVLERLRTSFDERQTKMSKEQRELQNDLLSTLSSHVDFYHTQTTLGTAATVRETASLHALNHVTKKRRRVVKNNERLARASKAGLAAPEDVQDQGFTRPAVLILLPFRSSALKWMEALTSHTPPPSYQVENRARFLREFGLPEDAVDKLAVAEPGTYPHDHVETFKGNVDDSFRVGIKVTRKSLKLFADFYSCDIIMASPLGLRMSMQKEKNWDFLSSIEMVVVDQMDALTMQNWEHLQFVFSHMNELPKESHNTDFSRIEPWYLDGHAVYLRQTVLLSSYETPESRSLYNHSLKNVSGKVRTARQWAPVQVPDGLDQNFIHFDCSSIRDEADKRFLYFTTQVLPSVLKSAVQSANTVIFVPSSLDFIRVHNHFRKQGHSFTVLSEYILGYPYSSNQDISRARQAFFKGSKSFLLISERFHFYRRYKIRGIRNVLFYGPPDHPQFYTEFLSYPFLDADIEPVDVTCRVVYSKYDWFKLERIAGTKGAGQLLKQAGV